jgi:aspartate carbamoyltransferase catalytic subunit
MSDSRIPGPESAIIPRQHVCAEPDRAQALAEAIRPRAEILHALRDRHVLSMKDFDAETLKQLFRLAAEYESGAQQQHPARGRILSNVYFDPSRKHTRLSFNSAWQRLGGSELNFEPALDDDFRKRHAPMELAEICSSYSDIAILRTRHREEMEEAVRYFRLPLINAGNGSDEHPTHAMADLYTLFKWRPELLADEPPAESKLHIAMAGDPQTTPSLRSLLFGLAQFPRAVERIVLFGHMKTRLAVDQQAYLENAGLKVVAGTELHPGKSIVAVARAILPESDLVYICYLHPMHATRMDMLDAVNHMKPGSMVLNSEVQDETFPQLLNDSDHNGYFTQARGSVFVRMALFSAILGAV